MTPYSVYPHASAKLALVLLCCGLAYSATATDEEAQEKIKEALEAEADGDLLKAGNRYKDAELLADDADLKAKTLEAAAQAYRQAQWHYREFECLESLLGGFPNRGQDEAHINRQYEIGNLYYEGYREPAAEWLDWTFFKADDHTVEIYQKALMHGPFAPHAAETKLRLGRMMAYTGQRKGEADGIAYLRTVMTDHPKSEQRKIAMLELAHLLSEKAFGSDGNEPAAEEARALLSRFIAENRRKEAENTQFVEAEKARRIEALKAKRESQVTQRADLSERETPKRPAIPVNEPIEVPHKIDPELPWAEAKLAALNEHSAQYYAGVARFYQKEKNLCGAENAWRKILTDFPTTQTAIEAEKELLLLKPDAQERALPAEKRSPEIIPARPILEQKEVLETPAPNKNRLRTVEDFSWQLGKSDAERENLRKQIPSTEEQK